MPDSTHEREDHRSLSIATGFDFQPLPDGNVLIEFFADDGKTFNSQIVTPSVIDSMPLVAALLKVALSKGPDVAREIVERLNERERV